MENKETHITTGIKDMSLLVNKPYIAYVFKKTQRIFQALYLVTDLFDASEPLRISIRMNANVLLTNATSFLRNDQKDRHALSNLVIGTYLETLTLIETASALQLLSENNHSILKGEINHLLEVVETNRDRVIHLGLEYMDIGTVEDHKRQSVLYKGQDNVLDIKDTEKPAVSKNIAPVSANAASYGPRPKTPLHQDTKNERLDKILSLFKPGEELMIKDIATHLKDVSEKTVQRELLLLVAKGSLRKKGERRWSRYTLK